MNLRSSNFSYLVPKSPNDLIRLGSEFDGGYVVSQKVVKKSQMLLSFGNGFNIDFEWDYVKKSQFRKKAIVFDGTHKQVSFQKFYQVIMLSLKYFAITPSLGYLLFIIKSIVLSLLGRGKFIKKNIELFTSEKSCTLQEVLSSRSENLVLLKMDIEGAEWELLDEIYRNQERFEGLIIEFHNVGSRLPLLKSFLEKMYKVEFNLDHLHACNYGRLLDDGMPDILEITLGRIYPENTYTLTTHLPIVNLDAPSSRVRDEIVINFT